jgi:glucose-6-phosphate isomerase
MLKNSNPTQTTAWQSLKAHLETMEDVQMRKLFAQDPDRFDNFSIDSEGILLDYSKNRITEETVKILLNLAEELDLKDGINKLFDGDIINATENRAVLHTALRNQSTKPVFYKGKDVMPDVVGVLAKMETFCDKVHTRSWKGFTGKPIKYIVNIGIGGSDLGPVMVAESLRPYWKKGLELYFASNVDGTHISETLKKIKADETLFVIASKTFTTQETMRNAHTARLWFLKNGGTEEDIKKHFIALSTNIKGVTDFGIDPDNMFPFWSWVGGRFSLSSSIGMSTALIMGFDNFSKLIAGLHNMDEHFRTVPFDKNMPVIMALIGIWYVNFFKAHSEAILPYDQYMHRFAAHFQQVNMESNGKSVDRNGEKVTYQTGPIIWGEPGTNGQHAFYQLIHQGTRLVPCDFIAPAISQNPIYDHHQILMSNYFAQTEAMMNGKTRSEVEEELKAVGKSAQEIKNIAPFKVFQGNIPTNSILVKKIDPFTLGQLIALYEHKIFVQGYIWNIFSFDQWGVELGKQLAKKILPELQGDEKVTSHDSSTNGLINKYKKLQQ